LVIYVLEFETGVEATHREPKKSTYLLPTLRKIYIMKSFTVLFFLLLSTTVFAGNNNPYPGSQGKPFQALQEQIDLTNMTLEEQTKIFNAMFADAEAKIQALSNRVTSNESNIELLRDVSQTHQDLIMSIRFALMTVETRLNNQDTKIEAIQVYNELQQRMIDAAVLKITAVENTANENYSSLYLKDQALMQANALLSERIAFLEEYGTGDPEELTRIQEQINSVEALLDETRTNLRDICDVGHVAGFYYNLKPYCADTYNGTRVLNLESPANVTFTNSGTSFHSFNEVYCPSTTPTAISAGHRTLGGLVANHPIGGGTGWRLQTGSVSLADLFWGPLSASPIDVRANGRVYLNCMYIDESLSP
jgi:hypothetical protein